MSLTKEFDLPITLERLAFGVRFEPQYRIGDRIGSIVDDILRRKGTPYGPTVFPFSESGQLSHRLLHPETGDRLTITQQDAILETNVHSADRQIIQGHARNFQSFILEPIRRAGIANIIRYGCLFNFGECSQQLAKNPLDVLLPTEPVRARDLALRFSTRLQTEDGHIKAGVNDYRNIIYSLQQDGNGQTSFSLDYQRYYDPCLDSEDWKPSEFSQFINGGLHYVCTVYADWLSHFGVGARAA